MTPIIPTNRKIISLGEIIISPTLPPRVKNDENLISEFWQKHQGCDWGRVPNVVLDENSRSLNSNFGNIISRHSRGGGIHEDEILIFTSISPKSTETFIISNVIGTTLFRSLNL